VSKSRSSIAVWLGVVLSVVAVGLLLWRVRFHDLGTALGSADAFWFVPSVVLFFVMFGLRAWRWSFLLGGTRFWATWHANMIGYFFNSTLPLRLGEIARAYVISKNDRVTMPRALSAVLVERLLDLGTVILLFALFAARIPMRPSFTRTATVASVAMALGVVCAVLFVVKGESLERKLKGRFAAGSPRAEALLGKLGQIRDGLRQIGGARRIAEALALTALVWGATIVLAAVCLRAFLPEDGLLERAGLVVVMANLGGALPSAPAGLGIVQGFATSALVVPFGVAEPIALAFVLVWSLGQQLVLVVFGFVSIGRVGLSFREIRAGTAGASPTP
jgi:uncharacterized protein (TIRG00374 family)